MGVGVFFSGTAVRGPAGVADAEGAVQRVLAQDLFKVDELTGSAAHLKRVAGRTADGNTRRVVAAVFEAPKPLDDDGNYLLWTNVADNAAHATILSDTAAKGSDTKVEGGPGKPWPEALQSSSSSSSGHSSQVSRSLQVEQSSVAF